MYISISSYALCMPLAVYINIGLSIDIDSYPDGAVL
jgi:hypothetical protein